MVRRIFLSGFLICIISTVLFAQGKLSKSDMVKLDFKTPAANKIKIQKIGPGFNAGGQQPVKL